jgi:ankyrin repeat protein
MPLSLPSRPNLDQLRKQAKDLLAAWRAGDAEVLALLREHHPEYPQYQPAAADLRLADAQLVLGRQYGFPSWPRLKEAVGQAGLAFAEKAGRFVQFATDESPGTNDWAFLQAKRMLAEEPALARADIYTALVLGDVETVRRQVERDPEWVRRKSGPQNREPLLYVTYSKFHRESPEIAERLLATAHLLLDHGADPDASFTLEPWPDSPLRSLCGACGVANFPAMAELLLDRGATIDDAESLYHSTEFPDTRCLDLLLARGANPKGTNALNHAFDRKGLERIVKLLDHGADPNEYMALHEALNRGRERAVLELLVRHGADVNARRQDGRTPYQAALQLGHREAAEYLAELGADTETTPFERFTDACGRGDLETARSVAREKLDLFESLSHQDLHSFLRLVQLGKSAMITNMIDCGFPGLIRGPQNQTALHWASWWGWRDTVEVLLARGAEVNTVETEFSATPLGWAEHGSENCQNPEGDYKGVMELLRAAGAVENPEG